MAILPFAPLVPGSPPSFPLSPHMAMASLLVISTMNSQMPLSLPYLYNKNLNPLGAVVASFFYFFFLHSVTYYLLFDKIDIHSNYETSNTLNLAVKMYAE